MADGSWLRVTRNQLPSAIRASFNTVN